MLLADCKDAVVSCVIVEPIYNHEREGRGNFVQEGKSGELASPPSLTQSSSVGGRLSAYPLTATASKSIETLTFIVQSIVAASHRSFSRFYDCWRYFLLLSNLNSMCAIVHRLLCRKPLQLQYFAHRP